MKDIRDMEGKIIDTRMNDLRIYEGRCPTLRAQRDGVLYVKNHTIYQLTGYETLLLQGFPKEYADRVKDEVCITVINGILDSFIRQIEPNLHKIHAKHDGVFL